MTDKPREDLVRAQYSELAGKYPGLSLSDFEEDKGWTIEGILDFCAEFEGVEICDNFQIKLAIPTNYPDIPPVAEEIGGLIPYDFHKNTDTQLCLAAPEEIYLKFFQSPTLLGFVNSLLVPYLYSYCYFIKFGQMPYGELSHGFEGLIEYYHGYFETDDFEEVICLLKILVDDSYKGHHDCPCGSGLMLRKCHGPKLIELTALFSQDYFLFLYDQFVRHYFSDYDALPDRDCISKKLIKEYKKQMRKRNERKA